jgi:hypothetical protein
VGKAKKGRRENITPHTKGLLNNYFTAAGAQRWTDDERIAMVKFLLEQDQFKHLDIPCVTRIYNLYIKATAMSKQIASSIRRHRIGPVRKKAPPEDPRNLAHHAVALFSWEGERFLGTSIPLLVLIT